VCVCMYSYNSKEIRFQIWAGMSVHRPSAKSVQLTAMDSSGQIKVFLVMVSFLHDSPIIFPCQCSLVMNMYKLVHNMLNFEVLFTLLGYNSWFDCLMSLVTAD